MILNSWWYHAEWCITMNVGLYFCKVCGSQIIDFIMFRACKNYWIWKWIELYILLLTLNVPVPYKYGTYQCAEPRLRALEPHLSRTSRALPTRVPGTRAAVRGHTRNSHSHASRGFAHFHAFCESHIRGFPRTRKPRISAQSKAAVPRISMNSQPTHFRATSHNNTVALTSRGSAPSREVANRCLVPRRKITYF